MLTEISKTNLMRRVHLVWWWRRATGPTGLKLGGLMLVLALEAALTSLPNIFINLTRIGNPINISAYLLTAFARTELVVQSVIITGFILLALITVDLINATRSRLSLRAV